MHAIVYFAMLVAIIVLVWDLSSTRAELAKARNKLKDLTPKEFSTTISPLGRMLINSMTAEEVHNRAMEHYCELKKETPTPYYGKPCPKCENDEHYLNTVEGDKVRITCEKCHTIIEEIGRK